MKKLALLVAAVLLVGFSANAQKWYVGGQIGFGAVGGGDVDLSILPEVGYSINAHNGVGAVIGYAKQAGVGAFNFIPYYRYSFKEIGGKINFFLDGQVPMAFGDGFSSFGIRVSPGIAFNPCKKLAFVAHLGALGFGSQKAGGASVTSWEVGVSGNALSLGVYYKF